MKRWAWVLVLAGCAGEAPVDHFYRLAVAPPLQVLERPLLDGVLLVEPPRAEGLLRDRELVHSRRDAPLELDRYRYHLWQDPPAALMQRELMAFLRQAGVARRVIAPEERTAPDFVLEGRLRRMEQLLGEPARVHLILELTLRHGQGGVIHQGQYAWERELEAGAPGEAVAVINQGVGEVFQRFLREWRAR